MGKENMKILILSVSAGMSLGLIPNPSEKCIFVPGTTGYATRAPDVSPALPELKPNIQYPTDSVANPDPDRRIHMFLGLPDLDPLARRHGSGSFYHEAKK
jgi:hypothetical protein